MAPAFRYPGKPAGEDELKVLAHLDPDVPQLIIPSGGTVAVDGRSRQIEVIY